MEDLHDNDHRAQARVGVTVDGVEERLEDSLEEVFRRAVPGYLSILVQLDQRPKEDP
jgi:hypothetical protein